MLSVGATKGKNLFEGLTLTMKYFFDAVGACYSDSLTFRSIDQPGEIIKHPTALKDAREKADFLVRHFLARKKILFLCTENSCRSQMGQAFTQLYGGDNVEAESAGSTPGEKINDLMVAVMKEKGIDMAFRKPKSFIENFTFLYTGFGCIDGMWRRMSIFPFCFPAGLESTRPL